MLKAAFFLGLILGIWLGVILSLAIFVIMTTKIRKSLE